MNFQIYRLLVEDMEFDLFRSEMEHMHLENRDIEFIRIIMTYNFVENFWKKEWYAKSLYTLAMLDYLSDKHHVPYYEKYNYYRKQKLKDPVYPMGIVMIDKINHNDNEKEKMRKIVRNDSYGKYFFRYNIMEVAEDAI